MPDRWVVKTLGEYVAHPGYARCQTCKQFVFSAARRKHNQNCRAVLDAWGTPEAMLAAWRADPAMTVATLVDAVPDVSPNYMIGRLRYAGMEKHELKNRYGGIFYKFYQQPDSARETDAGDTSLPNLDTRRCGRCQIFLSTAGTTDDNPDLCRLCADEIDVSQWQPKPNRQRRSTRRMETAG